MRHFLLILVLCGLAQAGTYYVSPSGSAPWSGGGNCTSIATPCSLATANTNAVAGDVVNLRGGTYSTAIIPTHSGSCPSTCLGETGASMITFQAYSGETPVITGVTYGISITNSSWIRVTGITVQNPSVGGFALVGSSYNEISYSTFVSTPPNYSTSWSGIGNETSAPWSTHNWVHHNYFSRARNPDPCGEAVDLVRIGMDVETGSGDLSDYNTFDYNYAEYGGHSVLLTNSRHNVIRGNIAHNEPWIPGCTSVNPTNPVYDNAAYNGLFGHRVFDIGEAAGLFPAIPADNLVEGNRVGFAGVPPLSAGAMNFDPSAPYEILRYNFSYGAMDSGIDMKFANSFGAGTGATHDHVYNNTIYHNGHGWNAGTANPGGNMLYNGEGIGQYSSSGNSNNVFKNNLVYQNGYYSPAQPAWDICILDWYGPPWKALGTICSPSPIDMVANNWVTTNGDPKFNNPDLTNTLSQNLFSNVHGYAATALPDLSLQAGSPAIDGGTWLTTANGSGTGSTTLVVADAWYFQDGTWGSDLARGTTFFADWIAIGNVSNTVQISSINYGTNTITLAAPKSWSNADHVWLYKKSDGAVVLNGSAPDYGAFESPAALSPPTNLKATVQ